MSPLPASPSRPAPAGSSPRGVARRAFLLVLVCLLGACLPACSQAEPDEPEGVLRVLFIGNSLTYTNDLPAVVQALAEAGGQAPLVYRAVTYPGVSLEDHWLGGEARGAIAEGGWDVVVLQQGPSALPASRELLVAYTRRFAEEIRRVGARPALYMVWPSEDRSFDFDGVSRSYREAAEAVDGLLVPVGEAWRAAWRRNGGLAFYSDGLHPTPMGTYLAALVFYRQLYDASPVGLPGRVEPRSRNVGTISIPEHRAKLLQEAAVEAVAAFGRP